MSGIAGIWRNGDACGANRLLAGVTAGLKLDSSESRSLALDDDAGVGVSSRFDNQQLHRTAELLVAIDADLENEAALRESLPEVAATGAAAELVAALYRRFRNSFVEKLRGRFSVIVWDRRNRKLVAAVDPFGIGRLVYSRQAGTFMVASRIDGLLASGDVDPAINPRSVLNVLNFSANLAPETIFTNIRRIPPGCLLVASDQGIRTNVYWDMRYRVTGSRSEAQLSREMEEVVSRAVASCCAGKDASETGAFLSGGTDSSTVVGMMARSYATPVRAFSIGFEEQQFNELDYAVLAARHFKAEHNTYLVNAKDCFQALPSMVRYFDEPFGNSSAIPTYFCARLAAQKGVKVLLAGDGGDELFGGNERYLTDKIFEAYGRVPRIFRRGMIEPMLRLMPAQNGIVGKARSYVRRANLSPVQRFFSYQFLTAHPIGEVFTADFLGSVADYDFLETPARYYNQGPAQDHLDRLLYVDVKMTLGDSDLPKVTCMAELAGIQPRFPFLDLAVAEFSGRISSGLKVRGTEKRYLFKQAFRKLLPAEVIAKKKHGFGIPVAEWMKNYKPMRELAHDTLLSQRACERGYFRPEFIRHLFELHAGDQTSYYGDILWTFLVLELWHQQVVDRRQRVMA